MQTVLEIKNLTKSHSQGKKAVDNLSLSVMPGEIHGFIGHNGAGKTTTIRAVVGVMDFDEGEIRIAGNSVKKEPVVRLHCKIQTQKVQQAIYFQGVAGKCRYRSCQTHPASKQHS